MSKKKLILISTAAFLVLIGAAGTLLWALLRVPDFYVNASEGLPSSPTDRRQAAKQLVQQTTDLVNNLQHAEEWSATFEQAEINSWLAEELHQEKYEDIVPEGVSDPRVVIHEGQVQLGFRFKRRGWSGIVSVDLKPWMADANQLAIEFESIRAGIVPIPLEDMLHDLSRQLVEAGWDVRWNHADGNDVAVINLNNNKPDAPILESLLVAEGQVQIRGHRKDHQPPIPQNLTPPQTAQSPMTPGITR